MAAGRAGAGVALALSLPAAARAGDWTRWKYDAANTGVNPTETRLGPGNVRGLRRSWFRDQCCVGTPLVAGGTIYVGGTENLVEGPGQILALDAATGEPRWSAPTGTSEPPSGLALAGGRLFASLGFEAAGGLVYVAGGPDTGGVLLAKDAGNGVNRWKAFPGP